MTQAKLRILFGVLRSMLLVMRGLGMHKGTYKELAIQLDKLETNDEEAIKETVEAVRQSHSEGREA